MIVSVLVLIGTVVLGLLRLKHERRLADREDARKVLAEAARELWRMKQTMRDHFEAMSNALSTGVRRDDFGTRIRDLEDRRDAVEGELDVLRIRFPKERDIIVAYTAAWEAVISLISFYMADTGGHGSRETPDEALKVSEGFDDRRTEFLAAAQKAAGAKLGRRLSGPAWPLAGDRH